MKKILEKIDIDAKHLKEILTILKMRAPDSTVIAFGSRVEFTAKPNSDLDLAIICDKKTAQKAIPRIVDDFQESDIPFNIDILDYNRLPDNIKKNIDKEFVEIYRPEQKKIPAGWTETTIQDVAVINELTVKNGNAPTVIEYIDIASVDKGQITEKQIMPFNKAPSRAKRIVRDNDILISTVRPNLEHYTFVKTASKNTIASTGFAVVSAKKVDSRFLYYILTQKSFTEYLTRIAEGHTSAYPAFNPDVIENAKIQIPSLSEQKAIAHILGSLDDKIELNRQMNQTLEAMAQAIFKSWFVDFDPVHAKAEGRDTLPAPQSEAVRQAGGLPAEIADLFPDSFEGSEMGMIPKGWKAKTLMDCIEIHDSKRIPLNSRQRSEKRGNFPYYGASGIMDYIDDYIFDGIYILLGEDGTVIDENDHPIIQYVWGRFWVNNHAHILTGKDGISNEHLYMILKNTIIKPFVTGAVQLKVSQTNLKSIPFVFAKDKVNKYYSSWISSIFEIVRNNTDELKYLTRTRDTLLPKLISGELRVPKAEELMGAVL